MLGCGDLLQQPQDIQICTWCVTFSIWIWFDILFRIFVSVFMILVYSFLLMSLSSLIFRTHAGLKITLLIFLPYLVEHNSEFCRILFMRDILIINLIPLKDIELFRFLIYVNYIMFFLLCLFFFWDRILLHIPSQPQIHGPPASASQC